ncbi:MerR family transcriptional regulator [Elstera cyanobacteriorum]|uniref:MerR family transcriptional regulator n=1 Tax=Elstera cyanobacteriorum TaxID=2022747 RepID=A0A255XU45_9PROT|nr:MerR family DNA-binding transcriptional regulator [Elstera cyanobacteriorum]MCK6444543.1 MerR family DNA-binding transcriptional regulator [Elstera cyanobacteriorum]OYQ20432.1 MerR family transcriptional regulator [Elstera cyanobacteriorum]GFZ99107.1 MerR family transcriptional regulator [Elstera cyanobacteriorum]
MSSTSFSIAQLTAEFDITPRAIRFYEDRGLITPGRNGNRRVYSPRDRVRLKLILRGKRLGLSLEEIREIIDMYDTEQDSGQAQRAQLDLLLDKIRKRRQTLMAQKQDIDVLLDFMDRVEVECTEALIALGDGGKLAVK